MRKQLTRLISRIGRATGAAFIPASAPDTGRVIESFIPIGHLYGIDFGNIDPAWYRKP